MSDRSWVVTHILQGRVPIIMEPRRDVAGRVYLTRVHGVPVGCGMTSMDAMEDTANRLEAAAREIRAWIGEGGAR